jgi:Na+/proline symporter
MAPSLIAGCIAGYFLLVLLISWLTTRGREASLSGFYQANRAAPWPLVAFGMIGTSLSGVTFISVPGAVAHQQMAYMQVALGYFLGYVVIAFVLLPLYYRLRLTSIYGYLQRRFGFWSFKTGAAYFLLSRSLGSAARLYLVAIVLQYSIFDAWGIPFAATVGITLALILLYTARGGIRTIIWTDTLQTAFMLLAAGLSFYYVIDALNITQPVETIRNSPHGQMFFFGRWDAGQNFWKQLLSGALIAIVMTGLDQDMMQKNLSVRGLAGARKNVLSYGFALILVNLLFVSLGVLLYLYAEAQGIAIPDKTDKLYPKLAFEHFGPAVGIFFILGLIAAAYSSADGSLAALTTSFNLDILGRSQEDTAENHRVKRRIHIGMTVAFFLIILGFRFAERFQTNLSVIDLVLSLAGYTYGPLLGLYAFGLTVQRAVRDKGVPYVCIAAPLLCLLFKLQEQAWFGITFGYELILLNGLLTFLGLWALSYPRRPEASGSSAL